MSPPADMRGLPNCSRIPLPNLRASQRWLGSRVPAPELPNRLPTRRPNLRANQRWLDDEVKRGSDLPKPAPRQVRSRAKQQVPAANQGALPNLRAGSRPRRHPDQRVWAPESTHSGRTGSQIAPAYAPASTGLGAPESTARGSTPRSQGFGRPNCSRIRRIKSTRKSGPESGLCSRLDGWPQSSPPRPAKQQAPTSGRPPKRQVRPGSGLPQVDGSRIYARIRRRRKGFEFAPESTGSRPNDFEPPEPHADRSWFGLPHHVFGAPELPAQQPPAQREPTSQTTLPITSPNPTAQQLKNHAQQLNNPTALAQQPSPTAQQPNNSPSKARGQLNTAKSNNSPTPVAQRAQQPKTLPNSAQNPAGQP